jgi:hypothetical protein
LRRFYLRHYSGAVKNGKDNGYIKILYVHTYLFTNGFEKRLLVIKEESESKCKKAMMFFLQKDTQGRALLKNVVWYGVVFDGS